MDGDGWYVIGVILAIIAVVIIVYIIAMIAGVLAAAAGIGGTLWGGGTAVANYGKSFKEHMIDSNRKAA